MLGLVEISRSRTFSEELHAAPRKFAVVAVYVHHVPWALNTESELSVLWTPFKVGLMLRDRIKEHPEKHRGTNTGNYG